MNRNRSGKDNTILSAGHEEEITHNLSNITAAAKKCPIFAEKRYAVICESIVHYHCHGAKNIEYGECLKCCCTTHKSDKSTKVKPSYQNIKSGYVTIVAGAAILLWTHLVDLKNIEWIRGFIFIPLSLICYLWFVMEAIVNIQRFGYKSPHSSIQMKSMIMVFSGIYFMEYFDLSYVAWFNSVSEFIFITGFGMLLFLHFLSRYSEYRGRKRSSPVN